MLGAASIVAAGGIVLFVTSIERGESGAAEPERTIQRSVPLTSAVDDGSSLTALDVLLADVAGREAVAVPAGAETTDGIGSVEPLEDVVLRVRARLSTGATPKTLVATLQWSGRDSTTWLEARTPDASGTSTFDAWREPGNDLQSVVVLATSRAALSMERDGRVLFESNVDELTRLTAPAPDLVDGVPTIDLGVVDLAPPDRLGTLRFAEPRADPFTVTVRLDEAQLLLDPKVHPRIQPYRTTVEGSRQELVMRTFGRASGWSVVVPGPKGRGPFHGVGEHGDALDVTFEELSGMDVAIDLVRHPRAARAVVFEVTTPEGASRLDAEAYDARELGAVRIAALPLPKRRPGLTEYPLGQLVLHDDKTYRIELWSTLEVGGDRSRLASFTTRVSGRMVEVRL
ncbi:MAG: hypothetical protein AAGB93_18540 [Planctomycetota bacterium]